MYTPLNLRTQVDLTTSGFSCNCRGLQCGDVVLGGTTASGGKEGERSTVLEREGWCPAPTRFRVHFLDRRQGSACAGAAAGCVGSESDAPWPTCCVISGMPLL